MKITIVLLARAREMSNCHVLRYTWQAYGRPADHDEAVLPLMKDKRILELTDA